MEFIILIAIIVLLLVPLVLAIDIPLYKEHKETTGNIINYDSTMRKFVYKILSTKEDIINRLQLASNSVDLSFTFDFEQSTILIKDFTSDRKYYFQIQECNGFSILRLEQVELIGTRSCIPYKLNPFFVKKLNAEIIPFSQYGINLT